MTNYEEGLVERFEREYQVILGRLTQLEHYTFRRQEDSAGQEGIVEVVDRRTGEVLRSLPVDQLLEWWARLYLHLDFLCEES